MTWMPYHDVAMSRKQLIAFFFCCLIRNLPLVLCGFAGAGLLISELGLFTTHLVGVGLAFLGILIILLIGLGVSSIKVFNRVE